MRYTPTIGLEIHAELKTATKMFCDCPNDPEEKHPNTNVCPICLGHPGVLPTINKKAIESMIKVGYAVGGEINQTFKFDRKNYFYPDLPKGYQISQYDQPIVKGGFLDISARFGQPKVVKLNRVHLEEDAGKLVHSTSLPDQHGLNAEQRGQEKIPRQSAFSQRESASLVDFNRGGVPLMELVSEPDMHSAKEAVSFAKELQLILRYLGVSDADLERGQMRFDANISLCEIRGSTQIATQIDAENISENLRSNQRESASTLGTKVEIKNLNSFAALEAAIEYEIERQAGILDEGRTVKQETRGWDDLRKVTVGQRSKEEAHDYRYFPEPDLPPLEASGFDLPALKSEIPELPNEKRRRFKKEFQLSDEQTSILAEDKKEADYFEEAVSELEADQDADSRGSTRLPAGRQGSTRIQLLFNYLNSDLKGLMRDQELDFDTLKITPENFADLIAMVAEKEISSRTAKDLLVKMLAGGDPRTLVSEGGLGQLSDEDVLLQVVKQVIANNPVAIADYKKGKINALQFLVGKAMAELKGRGNPEVLRALFIKELI